MEPGSGAAIGINSALLAIKLLYAAYLIGLRPQLGLTAFLVEAVTSCLEAAVCLCILVLQFHTSSVGVQTTMMGLEMALLLLQLLSCWAMVCAVVHKVVKKLAGSGKEEGAGERNEGEADGCCRTSMSVRAAVAARGEEAVDNRLRQLPP